jgi:hypothetical protein
VAYYDHRHSGIDETNILQVVKAVEGKILRSIGCLEKKLRFLTVLSSGLDVKVWGACSESIQMFMDGGRTNIRICLVTEP